MSRATLPDARDRQHVHLTGPVVIGHRVVHRVEPVGVEGHDREVAADAQVVIRGESRIDESFSDAARIGQASRLQHGPLDARPVAVGNSTEILLRARRSESVAVVGEQLVKACRSCDLRKTINRVEARIVPVVERGSVGCGQLDLGVLLGDRAQQPRIRRRGAARAGRGRQRNSTGERHEDSEADPGRRAPSALRSQPVFQDAHVDDTLMVLTLFRAVLTDKGGSTTPIVMLSGESCHCRVVFARPP